MTIILNGTTGITTPALDSDGNLAYTGTLTGGTGVINIGSGQVYKDASGNVGIGTSSPGSRLHVAGQIEVTTDTTTPAGGSAYFYKASAGAVISGFSNVFETGGVGSRTERARIDSSGNLLVGTTSSSYDALNNGFVIAGGAGITAAGIGHPTGSGSGTNFIAFSYAGTKIGSITQSGTTAVAYNTSSDYRLKENVAPMTGALEKVQALNPVTYTWKVDGSAGQGFIAHELQEVVPDCVTGEKDAVDDEGNPQYQGVDTSFLVATLVAAIQEQQTLITDLTARLEALEAL